jgi:AcrR family transcriptional regulator
LTRHESEYRFTAVSTRSSARKPTPMKEAQREAATQAIIEAAEQVAAERGLENASIAAIAKRAGVAVGTLYNYFPDREHLLASWLQHRRDEMVPQIEAAALTGAKLPFERRLRAYVADVLRIFEDKRKFVRVMASHDPKLMKVKERQPPLLATIVSTLESMFRQVVTDRAAEYARLLLAMVRGMALWRAEQDQPLDQDADLIVDTFLKGMKK